MPRDTSDSATRWIVLTCSSCESRCRLRADGDLDKARCPQCKALLRAQPTDADDEEEGPKSYDVSRPEKPVRLLSPVRAEDIELPPEPPEPPRYPLWEGVYSFPWRLENLRPWFWFGLGLTIVFLLGAGVRHVIVLHQSTSEVGQNIYFRVFILFVKALVAAFLWTGLFLAAYFVNIIQDTSAGAEKVQRPEETIGERLFTLLYLLWVLFFAMFPIGLVGAALEILFPGRFLSLAMAPALILFFPVLLLGSMANNSSLVLFSPRVTAGILERPLALGTLILASVMMGLPCLILGLITIFGLPSQPQPPPQSAPIPQYFLAPLTGFLWAACILIYGRLLGRIGWLITAGDAVTTRRAIKRNKNTIEEDEDEAD